MEESFVGGGGGLTAENRNYDSDRNNGGNGGNHGGGGGCVLMVVVIKVFVVGITIYAFALLFLELPAAQSQLNESLLFEACVNQKSLEHSKKVHDHFLRSKFRSDPKLNNTVISVFEECKSVTEAKRVFDHMADKNVDSLHLVMRVYCDNGMGDDALHMSEE